MVVKMMKWRPWPPLWSKKFEAKITVHRLMGLPDPDDSQRLAVGIKWRGSKGMVLGSLRRTVRRNFTKEEVFGEDGIVVWDEEFRCVCSFSAYKDGLFHPWEVSFTVFTAPKQGTSDIVPIIGTASLNLAEFASRGDRQGRGIDVPLSLLGGCGDGSAATLDLSIVLLELGNTEETLVPIPRQPILLFPRSPCYGEVISTEKDKIPSLKTSPRGVNNILKGLYSLRAKRTNHEEEGSDGRTSSRSEDTDFNSPLDTDSLHGSDEEGSEEIKVEDPTVRKSFSYGSLAYANHAGAPVYSNNSSSEDEDWVYYIHRRSDALPISVSDHSVSGNPKRGLLPWRKRKLGFRSPKAKGEPLLKKYYGEEGGDDIDFDRRQLSSSDEVTMKNANDSIVNQLYASEFGDDNFAVGKWECKEIQSRDGKMKLKTQVFFASIDQRSERAAGESACTALVAVIADWLHSNHDEMPIKSQFDTLIHEGSLEWRNLCENEVYSERFLDKHFDLETVLEAEVRPLSVVPEKSFIGFFQPEGLEDKGFDFLQGAMSFDNIWDEISRCASEMAPLGNPLVYIISWNDHFFILKVERNAYYIIDTLGERLHEGCNQAFILKFDNDTVIHWTGKETHMTDDSKPSQDKPVEQNESKANSTGKKLFASNGDAQETKAEAREEEPPVVVSCMGKETCKEYIKTFLAAIPIRELQDDLKKGLMSSSPLHHRLQIEFHYTIQPHAIAATEAVDENYLPGAIMSA